MNACHFAWIRCHANLTKVVGFGLHLKTGRHFIIIALSLSHTHTHALPFYFIRTSVYFPSFFFGFRVSFFVVDLLFLCKWISKFWRRNCFGIYLLFLFYFIPVFFFRLLPVIGSFQEYLKLIAFFFAYFFFTPNRNNFNKTIGLTVVHFISFSMMPYYIVIHPPSCNLFPIFLIKYVCMFCSISLAWFHLKYFSFWITKVDETML